jgi:hypothetical protein
MQHRHGPAFQNHLPAFLNNIYYLPSLEPANRSSEAGSAGNSLKVHPPVMLTHLTTMVFHPAFSGNST